MGHCTARCFVLTICVLQLVSTIERQVFDFLGYMWVPIIGNFFQILSTIFGFFGTYQYRPKYIIIYVTWTLIWIGWNIFIICFYLEIGILSRDSSILNINTGSRSWWEVHGLGCTAKFNMSFTEEVWQKPASVTGCFLEYQYIECIHAGIQILFSICGLIGGCYVIHIFNQEDDSFDFIGGFDSYTAYHSPSKTSHMQLQPITTTTLYEF